MMTSPLFSGLSAAERDALERRAVPRQFAAGESLFMQGSIATDLLLVTKGRIKVWRASEDGGALTLTLLGRGQPVGTLGATDHRVNHATATALTAVEAMAWPIDTLRTLMETSPALAANVLRTVTDYAEQMIERLEDMASATVEQRLARTILRLARRACGPAEVDDCELSLSRQDLADLTSATLPTVSRIMSRWRADGLISGTRGRVAILDSKGLGSAASRAP